MKSVLKFGLVAALTLWFAIGLSERTKSQMRAESKRRAEARAVTLKEGLLAREEHEKEIRGKFRNAARMWNLKVTEVAVREKWTGWRPEWTNGWFPLVGTFPFVKGTPLLENMEESEAHGRVATVLAEFLSDQSCADFLTESNLTRTQLLVLIHKGEDGWNCSACTEATFQTTVETYGDPNGPGTHGPEVRERLRAAGKRMRENV